jgi:hypothetical protein
MPLSLGAQNGNGRVDVPPAMLADQPEHASEQLED